MLRLVLLIPFITTCHATTIVVSGYSLNFNGSNCTIGQNLKVSTKFNDSYTLCDKPNQEQLNTICQAVSNCTNNTGLITSGGENGENEPLWLTEIEITFLEGCFAPVRVVCFDAERQCTLPANISNGHLSVSGKTLDLSLKRVVNLMDTVTVTCNAGYMSYYTHKVQCKKIKTAKLEWPLECIKIQQDRKMKMVTSVTDISNITALTGCSTCNISNLSDCSTCYYDVCDVDSVLCFDKFEKISNKSSILKLTGDYTYCIELSLVSLFSQAIITYNIPDLLEDVDTRPQKYNKRSLSTTPSIRIDMLGILLDNTTTPIGIIIQFYVVFFKTVLTPDKLTKLFDNLTKDQYNMTLQYGCAATCLDPSNCKAPAMGYFSKPKPSKPCVFENKTLWYGDMITLDCGPGKYIREKSTTYCLYGKYTSPVEYPTCGDCGQTLTNKDGQIFAPKREENKHVRGAHCTWIIKLKHNMVAWFNYPSDDVNCSQFIEIREMHPDTKNVIRSHRANCVGQKNRYGNLSSHIELTFISNSISDDLRGFEFVYHMIPPDKNWIEKYQTPILIASAILILLIGIVLIGMYCDHKKKNDKLRQVDINMRNVEVNDEISDSRPQISMLDKRKEFCDEVPLTPQPRKKKRRKKRKVSPGEVNDGVDVIEENSVVEDDKMWTTRNGRELTETDKDRTVERRSSRKDIEGGSNKLHRPLPPVEIEEEPLRQKQYQYNNARLPEPNNLPTNGRFQPTNGTPLHPQESQPETLEPILNTLHPITNTLAQNEDEAIRGNTVQKLHESNGGYSVTFKEDNPPPDKPKSVTKKKRRKRRVPDGEQDSIHLRVPQIERRPLPSIPPVHVSIPGGDVD